jgi:hypothetical protein
MAIFKCPRISTSQRLQLTLDESELVYDMDLKSFYGGDGVTLGGFPVGSGVGSITTEYITLTSNDIINKYVTLSAQPANPNTVTLVPSGGPAQINGIDFEVVGLILSWENLGLETFLEAGEVLIIQY